MIAVGLELWPAHSRHLPSCGVYEANLDNASLKSKKTNEIASYNLGGWCPGANSPLPQVEIHENSRKP